MVHRVVSARRVVWDAVGAYVAEIAPLEPCFEHDGVGVGDGEGGLEHLVLVPADDEWHVEPCVVHLARDLQQALRTPRAAPSPHVQHGEPHVALARQRRAVPHHHLAQVAEVQPADRLLHREHLCLLGAPADHAHAHVATTALEQEPLERPQPGKSGRRRPYLGRAAGHDVPPEPRKLAVADFCCAGDGCDVRWRAVSTACRGGSGSVDVAGVSG